MSDAGDEVRRRAEALVELGRHQGALDALAPLLADGTDGRALCIAAQSLLMLDRSVDAATTAERAIAADPDSPWPHRLRALALVGVARTAGSAQRRHLLSLAVGSARDAVQVGPRSAACYRVAVDVELEAGNIVEAQAAARVAVSLEPESAESWYFTARVELAAGRLAPCGDAVERALRLAPDLAQAWNVLGIVARRSGRWRDAAHAHLQACRLDPTLGTARANLVLTGRRILLPAVLAVLALTLLLPDGIGVFATVAVVGAAGIVRAAPARNAADGVARKVATGAAGLPAIAPATQVTLLHLADAAGIAVLVVVAVVSRSASTWLGVGCLLAILTVLVIERRAAPLRRFARG